MLIFLSGNDHFRLRLRECSLVADFKVKYPEAVEQIFDGRDNESGLLSKLQESLIGGLFATPRTILIRHVELYEEKVAAAVVEQLSRELSADVIVIASAEPEGRVKKGNVLQAWLAKNAQTETLDTLTGRVLHQSIVDILHDIDSTAQIAPHAVELLAIRTGGASGHIYHTLLKLVLVAGGRSITEDMVRSFIKEPAGESVAFTLLDALVHGQRERAVSLLRQEGANNDAVFQLLGLFAWQVRQALMVRGEYDRGTTSPDTIATAIGAKPFSVKKLLPLISKLPLSRLKRALAMIADIDHDLKTGQARPGVALDLFVWKF